MRTANRLSFALILAASCGGSSLLRVIPIPSDLPFSGIWFVTRRITMTDGT